MRSFVLKSWPGGAPLAGCMSVELDNITFSAAISANKQSGARMRAMALSAVMARDRMERVTNSYCAAISACAKGRGWSRVVDLLSVLALFGC